MADEYIKRTDAIMAVTRAKLPDKTPEGVPIANGKRSVTDCVRRLKEIRPEDVVHVVRCKDCVYYNTVGCSDGFGWCEGTMVNTGTHDNFFCAEGKKKDEA